MVTVTHISSYWLDLALVIDESQSMPIWGHTIKELKRLVQHYGIFRDVRIWGLITDEKGEVKLLPRRGKSQGKRYASGLSNNFCRINKI